jgi:hypothetical protein
METPDSNIHPDDELAFKILERCEKYKIKPSTLKTIKHLITKADPTYSDEFVTNLINSLIRQAILDYEMIHHQNRPDRKFWFD